MWNRKRKCAEALPNAMPQIRLNTLVFIEKSQKYQGFNPNRKHMSWHQKLSLQKRKKIFNTKYGNNIISIE